jgi:hypothetical protein
MDDGGVICGKVIVNQDRILRLSPNDSSPCVQLDETNKRLCHQLLVVFQVDELVDIKTTVTPIL